MEDQIERLLSQINFEKFYRSKVEIKSQSNDELKGICPFHDDKIASLSINKKSGIAHCFGCGFSGSIFQFVEKFYKVTFLEAVKILADFSGFKLKLKKPEKERPSIDPELPMKYLTNLLKAKDTLRWVQEKKGLTLETIKKYKIGWDGNRNTIPVYDEDGILRNIRRYNAKKKEKMISFRTKQFTYGEARIFGLDEFLARKNELAIFCEGEWDKLLASQNGFLAITGTTGASTFKPEWRQYFAGRRVVIIYDMDPGGRQGAENAARALLDVAASVKNLELPLKGTRNEKDLSDYFLKLGSTAEDLQALIDSTPLFTIKPEIREEEIPRELESFIEIDLKENIDKRVQVPLTVSGETSEAFHGVRKFKVDYCPLLPAGKCFRCPPDKIFTIALGDKEFIESCMSTEAQVIGFLRYRICPLGQKPRITILEKSTVREFFATQRTKRFFARIGEIGVDERGSELTERRVYFVSDELVKPQSYLATGYVRTHPKTQQVCLLATELEPIEEEYESFILNDEAKENLGKIRELTPKNIVDALSEEVLFLRHREELILATLLTFCSPLRIRFNRIDIRGWINAVILGDTATGKCLRGDSLLFTNFGMKRIEDIGNFREGEFLPLPNDLRVQGPKAMVRPEQTYKSKSQETIRITTKLGYTLEGTLNHSIIFLNKQNEPEFKKLRKIQLGDLVAIQYNQNCFCQFDNSHKIEVPDYLGAIEEFSLEEFRGVSRFLGYLIGDGDIDHSRERERNRIGFTNGNREIINDYQRIIKKSFDKESIAVKDKRSKAIRINFASEDVRNWLEDLGLLRVRTEEKRIPKIIFVLDKANVREFLRGIFETDGYVTKRDRTIGVSSASSKLINELKVILLNFGILSKTQKHFNKRYRRDYSDLILFGKNARLFLDKIGFISKEKRDKAKHVLQWKTQEFLNWNLSKEFDYLWKKYKQHHPEICHRNPKIKELSINTIRQIRYGNRIPEIDTLKRFLGLTEEFKSDQIYKKLEYLSQANIFWDRIVKLELSKNETFDLVVPNGHSFFANGFINHNTAAVSRFCDYVSIGDMVSGLSSSRTGITYGLREHKQKGWMIKIGRYPANTRKFVCIDEIQYIKARDVRTLGKAMDEGFITIDRIAEKSLESMTRLVALANPKEDSVMDELMFGCEGFRDLFDKAIIRRFDLAICLSHSDIKTNELNLPNIEIKSEKIPPKMLRDLIFWVWTRTSKSIAIGKGATLAILEEAIKLSEKFGFALDVPLVAPGDFANKLARLSTAYAALCVSTDKAFRRVIVKEEHVKFVAALVDYIYAGEAFGLTEYSEIYRAKTQLIDYEEIKKALENIKEKEKYIRQDLESEETSGEKSQIEQLLYAFKMHDEIRRRELADEIGSDEKTVSRKLQVLLQFNLIETGPRGYKKKPKFIKFLRRLARDEQTNLHPDRMAHSGFE